MFNIRQTVPLQQINYEAQENRSEFNSYLAKEPTVVRGTGNIMLFGLSNKFSTDLPPRLVSKVAPEEFEETISKINGALAQHFSHNIRWFLCGCFCFFCTLGCSIWPSVYLDRRTKADLEKLLIWENERLYNKLDLQWSLRKQLTGSPPMMEYVLMIEFLKKPVMYWPE